MPYNITLVTTTGTRNITVYDQTEDNNTSLTMIGMGFKGFGAALNQDMINIMTSFPGVNPPTNPNLGQLWLDKSGSPVLLRFYDGAIWNALATQAFVTAAIAASANTLQAAIVTAVNTLTFDEVTRALGYVPVQQGGGANMSANKIFLGFNQATGKVLIQVDNNTTSYEAVAFENWVASNFLPDTTQWGGDVSSASSGASPIILSLVATGSPGTYTKVTTDSKGRVVGGTALGSNDVTAALGWIPVQQNGGILQNANKIFIGWDGGGLRVTVDNSDLGQVAFNASVAATYLAKSTQWGGDVSSSSNGASPIALSLVAAGTPGTYTKVTTDSKGRVVSGTSLSGSDVNSALGYVPVQQGGGANMSANKIFLGFNQATGKVLIQVDDNTTSYEAVAFENFVAGNYLSNGTQWGGDVTSSSNGSSPITLALIAQGTPGTYTKVTTDTKGRVVSGANLSFADVTAALGYTPVQQGGGKGGQATNKIYMGFDGTTVRVTVDNTDFGDIAFQPWVGANYVANTGGAMSGGLSISSNLTVSNDITSNGRIVSNGLITTGTGNLNVGGPSVQIVSQDGASLNTLNVAQGTVGNQAVNISQFTLSQISTTAGVFGFPGGNNTNAMVQIIVGQISVPGDSVYRNYAFPSGFNNACIQVIICYQAQTPPNSGNIGGQTYDRFSFVACNTSGIAANTCNFIAIGF